MHVACGCGERVAVSIDRLPCNVVCSNCGRVFEVSPDGSTAEAHAVEPIVVETACRCGQPFTVRAEQFPRQVHCHVCGRHFNVLDDGQIVDTNVLIQGAPTPGRSTAIQADADTPIATSRAIVAEDRLDHFESATGHVTEEARLRAEVKLIDHMWKLEREQYSLIPFFGLEIMPSKLAALVVGLAMFGFWAVVFGVATESGNPVWIGLPIRIGATLLSVYIPIHMYLKAHEYERAVAAWQRKRLVAIAKCETLQVEE